MSFLRRMPWNRDRGQSTAAPVEAQALPTKPSTKLNNAAPLEGFLVIGIDFGTTFSGAAWASAADIEHNDINLITSWPDCGFEEGKAPTEIYYDDEDGAIYWGYSIPYDADPIKWFKLLLLRDDDVSEDIRRSEVYMRARKTLSLTKRDAIDVVADYLRLLWQHTVEIMEKARGKSVVEAFQFHIVITVPAIWKDYARQSMRDAAKKAGMLEPRSAGPTTLVFAPEPEAAALATLCEPGRVLHSGEVYVVCDAGGGTVDLISYRVGELDPLQLHEAVLGTGGLCGGIFIDDAFQSMCQARLGRRWSKLSQAGIREILKNEWERTIKPQFKPGDRTKEYIVAIPAEAFVGSDLNDVSRKPFIKNGRIHFTCADIERAISNVFADIGILIDDQIAKAGTSGMAVKGIILVGGLGASPYLYEYLGSRYSAQKIEVLQSTGVRPRTAICRGAIFKGFLEGPVIEMACTTPVSIDSCMSRHSLGLVFSTHFQEGLHEEKDKYWHPVEGAWKAKGQMRWYLKKGDTVSTKQPIRHQFYRSYSSIEEFQKSFSLVINQSEEDVPPSRYCKEVRSLCEINCNVEEIAFTSLLDYPGVSGKQLKALMYEVEMIPSGASNEINVYCQGKRLGGQSISIHFQ